MRPLTDDEVKIFFEKLREYIGRNIKNLIDREDEPYCFRLHKERVYYVSERVLKQATSISRDDLVAFGVCMGKFTKTKNFRLKVTALDVLAQHAQYKVWVKPGAEQAFLYGNHVSKAGLARMTEAIPQYAGVLVLSASNTALGFGRAAQTTDRCKDLEPTAIAVLHQADIGEYLREEADLI